MFSWILGRMVPYSGSVRPLVLTLEPGHVRVALADRAAVRNHLGSIHAIALANIAELASGLAMTVSLPPGIRGIVVHFEMDYLKKARGPLIAEARAEVPGSLTAAEDHDFVATVSDAEGDIVAQATVRWRLAPVP